VTYPSNFDHVIILICSSGGAALRGHSRCEIEDSFFKLAAGVVNAAR